MTTKTETKPPETAPVEELPTPTPSTETTVPPEVTPESPTEAKPETASETPAPGVEQEIADQAAKVELYEQVGNDLLLFLERVRHFPGLLQQLEPSTTTPTDENEPSTDIATELKSLQAKELADWQRFYESAGLELRLDEVIGELETLEKLPIEGGTEAEQQAVQNGFAELLISGQLSTSEIYLAFYRDGGGIQLMDQLKHGQHAHGVSNLETVSEFTSPPPTLHINPKTMFADPPEHIATHLAHEVAEALGHVVPAGCQPYSQTERRHHARRLSDRFTDEYTRRLTEGNTPSKIIEHEHDCQLHAYYLRVNPAFLPEPMVYQEYCQNHSCTEAGQPADSDEYATAWQDRMADRADTGAIWMFANLLADLPAERKADTFGQDYQTVVPELVQILRTAAASPDGYQQISQQLNAALGQNAQTIIADMTNDLAALTWQFRAFDEITLRLQQKTDLTPDEEPDQTEWLEESLPSFSSAEPYNAGTQAKDSSTFVTLAKALESFDPLGLKDIAKKG